MSIQEPDASDSFEDQIDKVPEENLKAPVKPGTDSGVTIPKEDWDKAHKAKQELKEDIGDTTQ